MSRFPEDRPALIKGATLEGLLIAPDRLLHFHEKQQKGALHAVR